MKDWLKKVLGPKKTEPALNATDEYVVVNRAHLESLMAEVKYLRGKDANELDMLVAELEQENRLLRARNERLESMKGTS